MWSIQNRNIEICELLINNGALRSINTLNKVNIICMLIYFTINLWDICEWE
jgi:hypothetical protein